MAARLFEFTLWLAPAALERTTALPESTAASPTQRFIAKPLRSKMQSEPRSATRRPRDAASSAVSPTRPPPRKHRRRLRPGRRLFYQRPEATLTELCTSVHSCLSILRRSRGSPEMLIYQFIWSDGRIDHIAGHGVTAEEVEQVCFGRALVLRAKSQGHNPV